MSINQNQLKELGYEQITFEKLAKECMQKFIDQTEYKNNKQLLEHYQKQLNYLKHENNEAYEFTKSKLGKSIQNALDYYE